MRANTKARLVILSRDPAANGFLPSRLFSRTVAAGGESAVLVVSELGASEAAALIKDANKNGVKPEAHVMQHVFDALVSTIGGAVSGSLGYIDRPRAFLAPGYGDKLLFVEFDVTENKPSVLALPGQATKEVRLHFFLMEFLRAVTGEEDVNAITEDLGTDLGDEVNGG